MEDKDKINILLKEYDTLRSEILNRLSNRFAFLGLFIAILGFVVVNVSNFTKLKVSVLFVSALILIGVWWQLGNVIKRCSSRIAEIEKEINNKAGEKLLKWESEKLGSKIFHLFHG